MPCEDIEAALRQRPFTPLRIHLSDSRSFLIRHPDAVLLGHRTMIIGLRRNDPENGTTVPYDRTEMVALAHVTSLERAEEAD